MAPIILPHLTMSTPAWYQNLLRQCREPGELTGVRITTLLERQQQRFLRQEVSKTKEVLVWTTIAYRSPSPNRIEYAAYRSVAPDKKMHRRIAVGRLFRCPLVLEDLQKEGQTWINQHVRATVQARINAGHPLRGGRRELPSANPFAPKAPPRMPTQVPRLLQSQGCSANTGWKPGSVPAPPVAAS